MSCAWNNYCIAAANKLKAIQMMHSIAKISKAVISQLVTSGAIQESNIESIDETGLLYDDLPGPVKEHATMILQKIGKIHKSNKELLKFLINRYPLSYTFSEISEWINYSESSLQGHVPNLLLKIGIISRVRKFDGYHYSSNLTQFIKEEFQVYFNDEDLEPLELIEDYLKNNLQSEAEP